MVHWQDAASSPAMTTQGLLELQGLLGWQELLRMQGLHGYHLIDDVFWFTTHTVKLRSV